ncbi:hypothetical protein, partial [Rhizobium leguminosarum]|uniref:hypothetical protein n=1 Tax=Rhizobium leguminosarum TaxID=384 RepID=UPI001C92B82F
PACLREASRQLTQHIESYGLFQRYSLRSKYYPYAAYPRKCLYVLRSKQMKTPVQGPACAASTHYQVSNYLI